MDKKRGRKKGVVWAESVDGTSGAGKLVCEGEVVGDLVSSDRGRGGGPKVRTRGEEGGMGVGGVSGEGGRLHGVYECE